MAADHYLVIVKFKNKKQAAEFKKQTAGAFVHKVRAPAPKDNRKYSIAVYR
jgi:hypothetical protein